MRDLHPHIQPQLYLTLSNGPQCGTVSLILFEGLKMVAGGLPTRKDTSQTRSSYKYYQICQCSVILIQLSSANSYILFSDIL